MFRNPYDTATASGLPNGMKNPDYANVAYDAVLGHVSIATTNGTPDTAVFTWDTGHSSGHKLEDSTCSADGWTNISTNCPTADTTQNYTALTGDGDDQCVEKWTL